jgi:hypothetical protein
MIVVAATLLLVIGFAVINASAGVGTISGVVTIGPWTPVEPAGGSHPPPEVYTSRRIILEGLVLPRVEIPMNGTGYFTATVRAGTYTLTMTNATFLGASRVFPMKATVKPDQTTTLTIDVDTGIR